MSLLLTLNISGPSRDKRPIPRMTWIADLYKFGVVSASYIPCTEIRMLREHFRYRQKLGHRSSEKNQLQNSPTVSNIALASVVSDTFGKSSYALIKYILPVIPLTQSMPKLSFKENLKIKQMK